MLAAPAAPASGTKSSAAVSHNKWMRYFFKMGFVGLFLITVVDSSPIPLPIPGSSDLLVTLLAAQRHAWLGVTIVATLGSIVGAASSYETGKIGGLPLVDKYVPKRFGDRMKGWAQHHALLSVALPAILPPPAPLMPFLIAAGALKMPKWKYYASFTASRFCRHLFFAWLGYHYGRSIMKYYVRFANHYGWIVLVLVWGTVVFAIVYAILKIRSSKRGGAKTDKAPHPAAA